MLSTFAVDDVEAVLTRLPSRSFRERFPGIIDCASARFIETGEAHPLIAAVHLAFSEHRPLVLTPDAVWLTIAQGFAQHVRLNSEGLRNRFVGHSGKKALIVEHPSPKLPEMVPIIEMFRRKLAEELGPGLTRLMICDFSTTTDVERTASAVILMDTFQPYYEYVLRCICGIPQITVTGTEQDWRAIGERVRILGEYDLVWWTTHLEKIVGQLQRAAAGKPDAAFFRRIYKPKDAYGGDVVTGWIGRLYPYVKHAGAFDRRNPLLTLDEESVGRDGKASDSRLGYDGPAIRTDETMPGLSKVSLVVRTEGEPDRKLDLVAGLAGVTQLDDGALEARAGWLVQESWARIDDVIEKLRQAGIPERPASSPESLPEVQGPADIMALYSAFDGGTLLSGWSLRPARKVAHWLHIIEPRFYYSPVYINVFADLPDESMLAFSRATHGSARRWIVIHLPPRAITERAEAHGQYKTASLVCSERDVKWIGNSVAEVLMQALETGGADIRTRKAADSSTLLDFADYRRKPDFPARLVF